MATNLNVPVLTDGTSFRTLWKPRILFSNSINYEHNYGIDEEGAPTENVDKWNTLSTQNDPSALDPEGLNLLFDNKYSYDDTDLLNNRTLYNVYYKEDINNNLSNNAYLLKVKLKLTKDDIDDFKFSDKIYFKDTILGGGIYKVNAINKYDPTGFSDVEIIKLSNIDNSYDDSIVPTKLYRNIITSADVVPGSSAPGAPAVGGIVPPITSSSNGLGVGSVIEVAGGDGMDFSDIVTTGDVHMGTPSTITSISANDASGTTHTHELETVIIAKGGTGATSFTSNAVLTGNGSNPIQAESNLSFNGSTLTVVGDVGINNHLVANDVSIIEFLNVDGDVSINGTLGSNSGVLNIGTDVSINGRLDVASDVSIIGRLDVVSDVSIVGALSVGATDVSGNLIVEGSEFLYGDISDKAGFSSGFAGSGWKLETDDNHLTVDNLTVRQSMSVYTLEINKIRATNGAMWVSDAVEVDSVSASATYYTLHVDTGEDNLIPFSVGDIIRAQAWSGNSIIYSEMYVAIIGQVSGNVLCPIASATGSAPVAGQTFVRVGSVSKDERKGAVYITSSDDDAPYIDVIDGYDTVGGSFDTRVRLGNLDGITDLDAGLDGSQTNQYGLYSQDVYLKGHIFSQSGEIGGFTLANNTLTAGTSTTGIEIKSLASDRYFKASKDSNDYVKMFYDDADNWGIVGKNNDVTFFQLGDTNEIGGFTFTDSTLTAGTSTTGIEIKSTDTDRYFKASKDSNNYVKMFYKGYSDWGIDGVVEGSTVFQLGDTNKIGGFTFTDMTLTAGTSTTGIEINSIECDRYFKVSKDSNNYVKMFYDGSSDWGIYGEAAGVTVFQLGDTNKIGGMYFDDQKLFSGNAKIYMQSNDTVFIEGYTITASSNYCKFYVPTIETNGGNIDLNHSSAATRGGIFNDNVPSTNAASKTIMTGCEPGERFLVTAAEHTIDAPAIIRHISAIVNIYLNSYGTPKVTGSISLLDSNTFTISIVSKTSTNCAMQLNNMQNSDVEAVINVLKLSKNDDWVKPD